MAKSKKGKPTTKKPSSRLKYVKVSNKSYGKALQGVKIYYEGKRPTRLGKDGKITFGKHILEMLSKKFKKFHWIITKETDSITLVRDIYRVRISVHLLANLYSLLFDRTRDIKNDLIKHQFSLVFPSHFEEDDAPVYVPGKLAGILDEKIITRLSTDDRDALMKFFPEFIASESVSSVNLLKAEAQIESLKELATELGTAISDGKSESWWQTYIKKNILLIQQGYIQAIEKMNVALGATKYPDFSLVTHDSYLDILEIKKPSTPLIKEDPSRKNFYWDTEMSKAIIQTENYIENISRNSQNVRTYLKDTFGIELQVLRPRGIILAGDTRAYTSQKERDDLRLLTQGLKNITVLTYDELLTRLKNYIEVLEKFRQGD
jgi:hypothetical protein